MRLTGCPEKWGKITWASSIRVDPTHKREFYKTRVSSDRLKELKETNTGYESD